MLPQPMHTCTGGHAVPPLNPKPFLSPEERGLPCPPTWRQPFWAEPHLPAPEGGGRETKLRGSSPGPHQPGLPPPSPAPCLERASPTSSSPSSFLRGEKLGAASAGCPAFKVIQIARGLICMAARCAEPGASRGRADKVCGGPSLRLSSHYHGLP